jgi:hypothetical protein
LNDRTHLLGQGRDAFFVQGSIGMGQDSRADFDDNRPGYRHDFLAKQIRHSFSVVLKMPLGICFRKFPEPASPSRGRRLMLEGQVPSPHRVTFRGRGRRTRETNALTLTNSVGSDNTVP